MIWATRNFSGSGSGTRVLTLAFSLCAMLCQVEAEVRLPSVFADGMVLQREQANPIWGWADPTERVTINFAGSTLRTTAGQDGRWKAVFPKLEANSDGRVLSVRGSSGSELKVSDVLVGEVWFFNGPSNIYWPVERCENATAEIAAADFPEIRFFTVPKLLADEPQEDCEGKWVQCSPGTVGPASGVAYFFSRKIHRDLGVPVGALQSFWGGTRVEGWTSAEAVEKEAALAPVTEWWKQAIAAYDADAAGERHRLAMKQWERKAAEAKREGRPVPAEPKRARNPASSQHRPGRLFNGMIAPLIPFGIRGTVTYQGLGNLYWAEYSGPLMTTLFRDWRKRWGQGDFPIGMIQPAPFPCDTWAKQRPDAYALQREAQLILLDELPNLGIAPTMDIGDLKDVHFRNKQEVGRRMALWALAEVYGQSVGHSGPVYRSMSVEGDAIRIRFKHVGAGLKTRDGKAPTEFKIGGKDGRFFPAKAVIDGETVVVKSVHVPRPLAVRFAWSDVAIPNLVNSDELPASIFRTDHSLKK